MITAITIKTSDGNSYELNIDHDEGEEPPYLVVSDPDPETQEKDGIIYDKEDH